MPLKQGDLRLLEADVARRLLSSRVPARFAYVATDGTPRVLATWFHWTGEVLAMPTFLAAPHVSIRLGDVNLDACRIRITQGKGAKDRYVPFPATFKETLALHISAARDNGAAFLFESSWKKPYSTRGVRAMLARYAAKAGLAHPCPWPRPRPRRRPA